MNPNKKSYAMKMLQLALALSLMHVDPDFFLLQQRFDSWDSQLESYDGGDNGGWELEMLRAVPMVEYPYANRKSMMPLIEDLIGYNRYGNQHNVTAYLLTQPNDINANQTAALQELQTPAPVGGAVAATATTTGGATAAGLELAVNGADGNSREPTEFDLFLESDQFQDHRPVWEQNLADLHDFGDLTAHNPYNSLKDEIAQLPQHPHGNNHTTNTFDVNLEAFLPTITEAIKAEGNLALNDTYTDPDDVVRVKIEQLDDYDDGAVSSNNTNTTESCHSNDEADNAACSSSVAATASPTSAEPNDQAGAGYIKIERNETFVDPFINDNEESEIVEVLWKQDVDLGFSLTPAQLFASVTSEELASGSNAHNATVDVAKTTLEKFDNIEDPKVLDELKQDKDKPEDGTIESDDGWANIPFTVDNETGEFIRLPLDELLNDVLQLTELAGELNEVNSGDNDLIASTSKEAAERKLKKEYDENNRTSSDVGATADVDVALKDENDDPFWLNTADKRTKGRRSRSSTNNKHNIFSTDDSDNNSNNNDEESDIEEHSLAASPLFDLDDEAKEQLADFDMMLQSAPPPTPSPFHHPHPHHHHYSHHATAAVHHPHRPTATATSGGVGVGVGVGQNYAVGSGANSAFQRQAASTGFHHGHHQGRMPLSRGVSMDIASFFNPLPPSMGVSDMTPYPHYPTHHPHHHGAAAPPPPPHHHAHYSYQAGVQHAQYTHAAPHHPHAHRHGMMHPNAALGDLCGTATQPHYGHNLGSAVTSSMHLTNTTASSHHDDLGAAAAANAAGAYKMEHDMMYYSNATSDMNHTSDGFINSILNDEDLHLMDMNVTDNFCRMVDVNNSTSNNSSVLGGHVIGASSATAANTLMALNGDLAAATATVAGATGTSSVSSAIGSGGVHGVGATGTDRLDASSDSAVSSMGSERVPSLSDGEWGEGSDSAQDYHQGKYGGPYDYSYQNSTPGTRLDGTARQPPVAQKKHQMFGKRFQNEQPPSGAAAPGEVAATANLPVPSAQANGLLHGQQPAASIKYEYDPYPTALSHQHPSQGATTLNAGDQAMGPLLSKVQHQAYDLNHGSGAVGGELGPYSLDFSMRAPRTPHEVVQHNHTYTMPQGTGSLPRPQQRDKKSSISSSKSSKSISNSTSSEDEHLTRDEKRARALNIPIPVTDIINLPMDEFNERLSKYDLTENQLSLIRDIRRRGKNKVAAQNCRKRKLDQILSLEDEVKEVRKRKEHLEAQRDGLDAERKRISNKFAALHRHIFQYLRDPDGNPCSTAEYSLQQAADGSIFLLPRDNAHKGDSATAGNRAGNQVSASAHHQHSHQMNGSGSSQQQQQQQHPLVLGQTQTQSHLSNQQQQQQQQQQQHQQQQQQTQQHALPHALPHSLHHNPHQTHLPHQKE